VSSVQRFPSLHTITVPAHLPSRQTSLSVQKLSSLQADTLFVNTHPVSGSQVSSVQPFPSTHSIGMPAHCPSAQMSSLVQALPSSQVAVLGVYMHPSAGTHESSVQTLPSSQTTASPASHFPLTQVSLLVHLSPLSHWAPSSRTLSSHLPVSGMQVAA